MQNLEAEPFLKKRQKGEGKSVGWVTRQVEAVVGAVEWLVF